MAPLSMTQRVTQSVGLLWTFVLMSAVVLVSGCLILSSLLTSAVRGQAVDDSRLALTQYANGVLAPRLVYGTSLRVGDSVTGVVNRDLAERPDILSVKIWKTDGRSHGRTSRPIASESTSRSATSSRRCWRHSRRPLRSAI